MSVYERVRHQDDKKHGKHFIGESKRTLQKTFLFLRTITLKRIQNTLYGKKKRISLLKMCLLAFYAEKRQNTCKATYIGKGKHITRYVYCVSFFLAYLVPKRESAWIALYLEKHNIIKTFYFQYFFFFTLCTKTQNCMESSIYGKRKRHLQKHVISVFISILGTKTVKSNKRFIFGKTKQFYQKRVFWVFWATYVLKP